MAKHCWGTPDSCCPDRTFRPQTQQRNEVSWHSFSNSFSNCTSNKLIGWFKVLGPKQLIPRLAWSWVPSGNSAARPVIAHCQNLLINCLFVCQSRIYIYEFLPCLWVFRHFQCIWNVHECHIHSHQHYISFSTIIQHYIIYIWLWVKTLVPLVNIKIAGKWMFIPLKMVLIGIDPYPYHLYICSAPRNDQPGRPIFQTAILRWSLRWPGR